MARTRLPRRAARGVDSRRDSNDSASGCPISTPPSRRVAALGGALWSEPFAHTLEAGGEIRLVLVGDPDGTAIELIEGGPATLSFVAITCADLDRSLAFYAFARLP